MRVVVDVEEVAEEEARVGVMIVKSMATVRLRHEDTSRSAGRSGPSGSFCSEAVVIPAIPNSSATVSRKVVWPLEIDPERWQVTACSP